MSQGLCPITLVGGYLGAGKTTLINRLLAHPELPAQTAVLVNDFGDINIDASLIRSQSEDGTVIGLSNGCICCSISDDLSKALDQMAALPIQRVILETSGVAEPARVWQNCNYPGFIPKASVVVVDAHSVTKRLQDKYVGALVNAQLQQGHLLVISKTDLNPDFTLDRLQPTLASTDPNLLGTILGWQGSGAPQHTTAPGGQFAATTWHQRISVTAQSLETFLHNLDPTVQRVKGWVQTDRGILQVSAVGEMVTVDKLKQLPPSAQLGLVLIYWADAESQLGGVTSDQITITLSG